MSTTTSAHPGGGLRLRLSVMMFLQFFIWGAWYPLVFGYLPSLNFNENEQFLILATFNVAALVALFFSTQFADRNFAAERFLAFSHLVGGVAIIGLFFLPLPTGTQPGQANSVKIVQPTETTIVQEKTVITRGQGTLPDGTKVNVEGLELDQAEFDKKAPEKKPIVAFVVTDSRIVEGQTVLTGDAKAKLAPLWPFFGLLLLHSLFYVPTISITNSIAFSSLKDAQKEFGQVRLWGTIGWIAAAWPFVFILVDWGQVDAILAKKIADGVDVSWLDRLTTGLGTPKVGVAFRQASSYIFVAAGAASLVLAAFSLFLPHTPPKPAVSSADRFAWLEAMRLLRHPYVLVLFVVTLLDAAIHQCYFYWTERYLTQEGATGVGIGSNWATPIMSIGQVAEILTMAVLGVVLGKLGWRTTMVVGILGHAARFAVFAFLPFPAVAITANLLHGICYAFFFATVYIFVDEFFPKNARSSAQGLFNALILGVGPVLGNYVSGRLGAMYKTEAGFNFQAIFLYPMGTALVAAALLILFFHPPKKAAAADVKESALA